MIAVVQRVKEARVTVKGRPFGSPLARGMARGKYCTWLNATPRAEPVASDAVNQRITGLIGAGVLIFLGVAKDDTESDIEFLARKIPELRIFEDAQGKMNLSAGETEAEFLVVSQFTLLGDCSKGRRPSFDRAADPKKAEEFYELFVSKLRNQGLKVATGEFRAKMDVMLTNDGPVTFILDSGRVS